MEQGGLSITPFSQTLCKPTDTAHNIAMQARLPPERGNWIVRAPTSRQNRQDEAQPLSLELTGDRDQCTRNENNG